MLADPAEERVGPSIPEKARLLGDEAGLSGGIAVGSVEGVEELAQVVLPAAVAARPLDHRTQRLGPHGRSPASTLPKRDRASPAGASASIEA